MSTARRIRYCAAAMLLALAACSSDDTSATTTAATPLEGAGDDAAPSTSIAEARPAVVTLVSADGMTLPAGPVSLVRLAETEAGTLLVVGSDYDAAAGVRVPVAWEGSAADSLTATTLPALEPGGAGGVSALATTDSVTLVGGSSARSGEPHPVLWQRDETQWQLLELPAEAEGGVIAVDADGDRYAAVTSAATGRALWFSDNRGGDWTQATAFPFLDDSITGIAVTADRITVAGFEEGTALLTSTADGATYDTARFPGATMSTIADDGTTIVAGGATGRTEQIPAIWRSTDGVSWEPIDGFGGGTQGRAVTSITQDPSGFVATTQFEMGVSVDGTSWDLLDQAAAEGALQTARIGSDLVAITGGDVVTLEGNAWVTTTVGPTLTEAPVALDTAVVRDTIIVAGRNAANVPTPVWRSTTAGNWELDDIGTPVSALAATADTFAALSATDGTVSLLTSPDGQVWQSQPVTLAETGFFPNGLAAAGTTVVVYGDDADVDGSFGGALVVWTDVAQAPTVVQPDAFINDATRFTNLDALCVVNPEVWVAIGGRQDLAQGDATGVDVQAATTADGGVTWETQTVRAAEGSFNSVQDCIVTTDGQIVAWGTSQSESSFGSWVSISPDRDTWIEATPSDLNQLTSLITSIVQLGDATIAFGSIDDRAVAWSLEGTTWERIDVPGLTHAPLSAATDGTRIVLHAADPSRAVVYEGLLAESFGG